MSVKAQSTISLASVKTVNDASQFAVQQAGIAKASADNASEYASRALGNLATVQSVSETLAWITQHGTMTLTTDTVLDPTHVYFVLDPNGDYTVGSNTYSIVTEPSVDSLSSYYELTIDESLNNYVGTHLALTSEGLWLLPASTNANKVLIATGAGVTYTTAGTYLIDSNNDVVASFRANGVTIGRENYGHVEIANDGMVVRGEQDGSALTGNDNNTYIASRTIFVGGGADTALASIDLGSSRSNILSFHDTSGGANEHRTQIETRYDGATATATDVSTILDAVGVNNKTARLEMSVDSNAQSECYISADSINWNGNSIPMVIEQGTSNGWIYRKWSDGVGECWRTYSQTINSNTTLNNVYLDFPFTFTAVPTCIVGLKAGGANYYHVHCLADGTTTSRIRLFFSNTYSGQATITAECHIMGRWN